MVKSRTRRKWHLQGYLATKKYKQNPADKETNKQTTNTTADYKNEFLW